jgi:hypothetical protein
MNPKKTLVTCYIVHVIRDAKFVRTIPESFSRESADAYVTSFNDSVSDHSHAEQMVIVKQQVNAELPGELAG